jgi:molecular chaperone GrpE
MPRHDDAVDPDLVEDLGPELELRGDQLEEAVEAARAEAEQWRDKALRAQADFENARKRLESRHADEVRRAGERVITTLLPVMDDLERAADHLVEVAPDMAEGIVAVQRKLLAAMQKEGVTQMDPMGQPFDPAIHQAVQTHEDPELPDHSVCDVLQKGYEMHGRVLRPAMVVVCTGGPSRE